MEGALKLKEISYIHAEAYAAGEMKHGPIALITPEMPVVVVATRGHTYDKVVSNIQEVRARGGAGHRGRDRGRRGDRRNAEHVLYVPETSEDTLGRSRPSCRCSCWRTTSRSCAAATSTSRATSPSP